MKEPVPKNDPLKFVELFEELCELPEVSDPHRGKVQVIINGEIVWMDPDKKRLGDMVHGSKELEKIEGENRKAKDTHKKMVMATAASLRVSPKNKPSKKKTPTPIKKTKKQTVKL